MALEGAAGVLTRNGPESGRLFEEALARSRAAVFVVDDERRLRAVSEAACEILGRDREELLARRIDDCLPPESQTRLRAAWPGCLKARTWVHEVAFLRPDGSLRTAVISATANVVPGLHMVTFDLEPDHPRTGGDLERLFEDSPDLLVTAGSDGYFARVNPAFEHTLGFSREELLARPYLDLVHADDLAKTLDALERLRGGAFRCTISHRLRCRDGGYRTIEWHVARGVGRVWLTAVGRVTSQHPEGGPPGPSLVRGAVESLAAARDQAQRQEWLGDETYRGIEPSLVWAIEQQLQIVDDLTLSSAVSRVAAVRCALALRQALVDMGAIVDDLRGPVILADPAGGGLECQLRHRPASLASAPAGLTERELEVVRLVAQGHDNRMIGGELFLAEVTVKKHVQGIMAKFGATSRIQAAIAAVKLGLDR